MVELLVVLGVLSVSSLLGWTFFLTRLSLLLTANMNAQEMARKWNEDLEARVKARVRMVNVSSESTYTAGLAGSPPRSLQSYGSDEMVEEQPSMEDIMQETHSINQQINRARAAGIDRADELSQEDV